MSLEPNPTITDAGNPAKPAGEAGEAMLLYMNEEHSPLTEWAIDLLSYNEGEKILDVGCGGGATLRRLSQKSPKALLYGVDYSEVSVKLTGETNRELIEAGRMKVVHGSVDNLPFSDDCFDKIVTVESFYFWPTPVDSLREVYRVLKPGGEFLLVSEIYERDDLTEHIRDNIRKYDMFVPGTEEFKQLFEAAGFDETVINLKDGEFWIAVLGKKK